jgi:hypothetical protein
MTRFTAALVLATPVLALAQPHDHDRDYGRRESPDSSAVLDRGDTADQLAGLDQEIYEAMGRIRGKPAALAALRRARLMIASLREQVDGAPSPREWFRTQREAGRWSGPEYEPPRSAPPPPAVAPGPPPVQPISEPALAQLVAAMDRQTSSIGRLRVLQQNAPAEHFLVRQVQVLIGRCAFPPDQAQAARLLRPLVLDRENEYLLAGWLQPQPSPYAGLVERGSFEARSSVRLQPGVYRGDFAVTSSVTLEGAGRDQTVIDGNLVVTGAFNKVRGLTVLGRVVFQGSQNQMTDVDYRGGIDDRGQLNRY